MKIDLSKYKSFAEKAAYLVENKPELIEFKRQTIKYADAIGTFDIGHGLAISKALFTDFKDDPASGIIKRTIVGNTYNWMDSHEDVHLNGTFTKSIKERGDKIWHLHDHEYKIVAKVGKPTKVYEKTVKWSDLGQNIVGETQALFMDASIMKAMNEVVFTEYLDGTINQHSVGMQYVKIDLAINDPQYKDEYATWQSVIHLLGNRQKAENTGYFWAVREAKLIEISAVLEGSNELTPTVSNQPDKSTASKKPKLDHSKIVSNFSLS